MADASAGDRAESIWQRSELWSTRLEHEPQAQVTDITGAFQWLHTALDKLLHCSLISASELMAIFARRLVTCSSAFSGIGTPETSHNVIVKSLPAYCSARGIEPPSNMLAMSSQYAVEWDRACIAELLVHPAGPQHIFGNILNFCEPRVVMSCGLASAGMCKPNHVLRQTMPFARCQRKAFCWRHRAQCEAASCELHEAGSPCTDYSSMGAGLRSEGPCAKLFYQWVSQRRELRDRLVLHENVPRFGVDELREQLGDLYYMERSLVSPKELGWASARPRQITVLILKQWLDEILASTGVPPQVGVHASNRPMSGQDMVKRFVHFVRALFSRACNITLDAYLNEAEVTLDLVKELNWSCNRRGHKHGSNKVTVTTLPADPEEKKALFLSALIPSELQRLHKYRLKRTAEAYDLGQNPDHRALRSKDGILHTLIRNLGTTWVDHHNRFMAVKELLTAMGYPCLPSTESAVGGAGCSFSSSVTAPQIRCRSTMAQQCGNAMHVNVMGSFEVAALLLLPLGSYVAEPCQGSGVADTASASGDAGLKRKSAFAVAFEASLARRLKKPCYRGL